MLPQVATHILHHTSRAVAAVHNQTSQAIRNAWQIQQTAPSTSSTSSVAGWGGAGSSSGWGGSSTGAGGAKYNAGSRCYNGYTGPGRSITQANQTSAQQSDDNDDRNIQPIRIQPPSASVRPRPRSNSLSLSTQGRIDREEGLGVLKVVQKRARHAFATNNSVIDAATDTHQRSADYERPLLVRRNSTSIHSVAPSDSNPDLPPPSPLTSPPSNLNYQLDGPSISSESEGQHDSTDSVKSESESEEAVVEADLESYTRLFAAASSRNYDEVVAEVQRYRSQSRASVPCFNMSMQALSSTRPPGEAITLILELYNEMLSRSLLPNLRTYKVLITAMCFRDIEVQRVIASLESRISRRIFTKGSELAVNTTDERRVARLRAENNFASALTLFQAATSLKHTFLGLGVYNALLRSCAHHRNVDAAIRIYAHMERFSDLKPSASTFLHLMSVYCNSADLEGAREVFNEFKEASKHGRINWGWSENTLEQELYVNTSDTPHESTGRSLLARSSQVMMWNKMIEAYFKSGNAAAALGLLESMLDTKPGESFGEADAPLPNSATYTTIITGFCEIGDWRSAISWFDRLLAQSGAAKNPFQPLPNPPRPDQVAWVTMIDSFSRAGPVDDLNRLFTKLLEIADEDGIHIRTVDRHSVFRANVLAIRAPGVDPARSKEILDFLLNKVVVYDNKRVSMALTTAAARDMLLETVKLLVEHEQAERALDITESYAANEIASVQAAEAAHTVTPAQVLYHSKGLRAMIQTAFRTLLLRDRTMDSPGHTPSLRFALRVAALCKRVGLTPQTVVSAWYIHSYVTEKSLGEPLKMSESDWELLLDAFIAAEIPPLDSAEAEWFDGIPNPPGYTHPGFSNFLADLASASDIDVKKIVTPVRLKIAATLVHIHGLEEATRIVTELGPNFESLIQPGGRLSTISGSRWKEGKSIPDLSKPQSNIHIDLYHSRFVDEWYPANPSVTPRTAFERFVSGVERGIYPSPETLGRLISGLGRLGDVDKVRILYEAAQHVLATLEGQKRWQSAGWFVVEDQMIIAFAHAGDFEAANVHRGRIIQQGGTPSADAYGAMISSVKDTTDDTTNALALWQEAISRDVRANTYLYNTIISKLSKARKADHALIIFRQMKSEGIKPSSITFGALISACCRVGDAQSAEHLFHEMTTAFSFKPRAPPYNTMIQLYTYTKPNRERVLYYYDALLTARVKPTSHTYKLLLEAHGTIQPIDLASMEEIFRRITESRDIEVNGGHWGALINAYGCSGKDLERAIAIFESIAHHPSTVRASSLLPDAVAYEALFTVFALHRRPDLIRDYLERLRKSDIHPTAYVANAAIKGYAAVGDLDAAREIFEGLEDPPIGVAAPHNHAPHEHHNKGMYVSPQAPVYREPSTWETMVRAELGVSEHERALDLIKRMEARQFPPAVVQRVRDIMHIDPSDYQQIVTPPSSLGSTSPS